MSMGRLSMVAAAVGGRLVGRDAEFAAVSTDTNQWEGTVGHAQAIRINRENGFFEGGADPRGDGSAAGY